MNLIHMNLINANILLYKVLCDQKNIKEKVKYFIKHGEKNE